MYQVSNGLFRLIYVSEVADTEGHTEEVLADIEKQASLNNTRRGVTGALIAHNGFFVQALEGDYQTLSGLYLAICNDSRHSWLKIICSEPIDRRAFAGWGMKAGRVNATRFTTPFDPRKMTGDELFALLRVSVYGSQGIRPTHYAASFANSRSAAETV